MIEFTLPVKPVTKKNKGQIVMIGGSPRLLPSKQYRQFEKDVTPYLKRVKIQTGEIHYPVNIQCRFYVDARRRVDLTNLLNAIDDAMVHAELLIDDNRDIIAAHDGSRVFHDKDNPRIEIKITELKDYIQWKDSKNIQKSLLEN